MRRTSAHFLGAAIQSFALREVLKQASDSDPVFAEAKGNGFQFLTWPGADAEDVGNHLLQLPISQRGLHVVFGRNNVPVDLAIDLDGSVPDIDRAGAKINPTTLESKTKFIKDVTNSALESIDRQADRLFGVKVERRNVLQSLKPLKISLHIHARFDSGAAFADHTHLKKFITEVHDGMTVPGAVPEYEAAARSCVDTQIYRSGGTLRVYSGLNRLKQSPMVLAKDDPDWQRGPTSGLECMMMSWITRPPLEIDRELKIGTDVTGSGTFGARAHDDETVIKLRHIPGDPAAQLELLSRIGGHMQPQLAVSYRDWSTVGVVIQVAALRLIKKGLNADNVTSAAKESFHDFSRLCSHKYNAKDVDRKLKTLRVSESRMVDSDDPRLNLVWLLRRCATYPEGLVDPPPLKK